MHFLSLSFRTQHAKYQRFSISDPINGKHTSFQKFRHSKYMTLHGSHNSCVLKRIYSNSHTVGPLQELQDMEEPRQTRT
jgi:hypothetical protein